MTQAQLFSDLDVPKVEQFSTQLLKWVGNKQRFAHEIVSSFPSAFNNYFEPFLGSGAVLATLAPKRGVGSDAFNPIIEIFQTLQSSPDVLVSWYRERWETAHGVSKISGYEAIKASYNSNPNGPDLLFLCRACYGGVVRFRKLDGYMSTPCGVHEPINPESFEKRANLWALKVKNCQFINLDYKEAFNAAKKGDLIYCDPPYVHSQAILYGGQDFKLDELFVEIDKAKKRGVYVALSIDGSKKSGTKVCDLPIPTNLFNREIYINLGRSMLRRFQMEGQTLENEIVSDRLLLTY